MNSTYQNRNEDTTYNPLDEDLLKVILWKLYEVETILQEIKAILEEVNFGQEEHFYY